MTLCSEQRTAIGLFAFSKTHLRKLLVSSTAPNSNSSTKLGSRESQRRLETVRIECGLCGCEMELRDEEKYPETTSQRPSPVTGNGDEFSGEVVVEKVVSVVKQSKFVKRRFYNATILDKPGAQCATLTWFTNAVALDML